MSIEEMKIYGLILYFILGVITAPFIRWSRKDSSYTDYQWNVMDTLVTIGLWPILFIHYGIAFASDWLNTFETKGKKK